MNKEDYVQSVFPAVKRVFNSMFQKDVQRDTVEYAKEVTTDKVTISIGVTGELQGSILFSFPKDLSLNLVEEMSMMEVDELDTFVISAVGELANIISGHTATALNEQGYHCDIAPPQVIKGESKVVSVDKKENILMAVKTAEYDFKINISLQES
ncbi:MAG: chemotaxis protein CheX [Halanaerobacter sp.]